MTKALKVLLLIAALVLFLIGAFGKPLGRVQPVALGLACWVFVVLLDKTGWDLG